MWGLLGSCPDSAPRAQTSSHPATTLGVIGSGQWPPATGVDDDDDVRWAGKRETQVLPGSMLCASPASELHACARGSCRVSLTLRAAVGSPQPLLSPPLASPPAPCQGGPPRQAPEWARTASPSAPAGRPPGPSVARRLSDLPQTLQRPGEMARLGAHPLARIPRRSIPTPPSPCSHT